MQDQVTNVYAYIATVHIYATDHGPDGAGGGVFLDEVGTTCMCIQSFCLYAGCCFGVCVAGRGVAHNRGPEGAGWQGVP